jgi:ATP-dependent DNA helicase RecQ
MWRDAGWGQTVAAGKCEQGRFADELVAACVDMVRQWNPAPAPAWVACIPSIAHPILVPDFAARLASALGLPFHACVRKVADNSPQKTMENSFQQAHNLDGVFEVDADAVPRGPCLLVDDVTDSGWTFTVAAAVLRRAGCGAVIPLALAQNSLHMN